MHKPVRICIFRNQIVTEEATRYLPNKLHVVESKLITTFSTDSKTR
jgi:hypothetical protein